MITFNRKHSRIVLVDNLIKSSMTFKARPTKIMNFGSVFHPLYYLSRIWGLVPFSIVTKSNGDVQNPKIHLRDVLFFAISFKIRLLFSFISHKRYMELGKANTLDLCVYLFEEFSFLYGILIAIMNVCNRFKLMDMLKMYNHFDKEVYFNA